MSEGFAYTFFGVRGSYPVAGFLRGKLGGNTASVLCESAGHPIIFDAGTGIISVGNYLQNTALPRQQIDIFLTHYHYDHIQGLPFFHFLFEPDFKINIYCPVFDNIDPEKTILSLFARPFSPYGRKMIKADLNFIPVLKKNSSFDLSKAGKVESFYSDSHPLDGVMMYKFIGGSRSFVFATDIEYPGGFDEPAAAFVRHADVLVHDAQYSEEEYFSRDNPRNSYGHCTVAMAVRNALACGVRKLFLFHFDPMYGDEKLAHMLNTAREKFPNTFLAREQYKFE